MNTNTVSKITVKEPPRLLHCGDCKTTHNYDRPGVWGKIYVRQCCGKERRA